MNKKKIASRLVELRTQAELTQAQVARELGFRQSTFSMWENGARVPRDDSKRRIAIFFDVSVDEIFYS